MATKQQWDPHKPLNRQTPQQREAFRAYLAKEQRQSVVGPILGIIATITVGTTIIAWFFG